MNKTVKASEFKAKCLSLLDRVNRTREEIIVTKHGKPISKLVPYTKRPASLFGVHQERIRSRDDLVAPTGEEWRAEL